VDPDAFVHGLRKPREDAGLEGRARLLGVASRRAEVGEAQLARSGDGALRGSVRGRARRVGLADGPQAVDPRERIRERLRVLQRLLEATEDREGPDPGLERLVVAPQFSEQEGLVVPVLCPLRSELQRLLGSAYSFRRSPLSSRAARKA
jgi:hypothetical protein